MRITAAAAWLAWRTYHVAALALVVLVTTAAFHTSLSAGMTVALLSVFAAAAIVPEFAFYGVLAIVPLGDLWGAHAQVPAFAEALVLATITGWLVHLVRRPSMSPPPAIRRCPPPLTVVLLTRRRGRADPIDTGAAGLVQSAGGHVRPAGRRRHTVADAARPPDRDRRTVARRVAAPAPADPPDPERDDRSSTVALLIASTLVLICTGAQPHICHAHGAGRRVGPPRPSGGRPRTRAARPARPVDRRCRAARAGDVARGRRVPVRAVGTTEAGLLDVPDDIDRAGWWRGGARLGDPFGATLVAAHVDSRTQGLGPFAELLTVATGARIRLDSAHLTQTFEVRSRQLVAQGSLDRETWLFDARRPPTAAARHLRTALRRRSRRLPEPRRDHGGPHLPGQPLMPKKSYQKGLPTVLPPSPPAPRRSPESTAAPSLPPRVAAPPTPETPQPEVVRTPVVAPVMPDAPGRRLPRGRWC